MVKKLKKLLKGEREKYVPVKKVQDLIPVDSVYEDGIFRCGGTYSKMFSFTDINYQVSGKDSRETLFYGYCDILNAFDPTCTYKITINNRKQDEVSFEKNILLKKKNDGLTKYRKEYNDMLNAVSINQNRSIKEKYITLSVQKKDISEARTFFKRAASELSLRFSNIGSKCEEIGGLERIRILYDFFRPGEESDFGFDFSMSAAKGHSFKDYISPDYAEKSDDYIKLGEKYVRVLFMKDYATYIKDTMISEISELNNDMIISIDIIPIPTEEAVREVENRLLGVETNITNWQRKQNQNNNYSAVVPYDMELQRNESKEFLSDLTQRDQRMLCATLTIGVTGDSTEELNERTQRVISCARKHLCQVGILKYQQTDALNTLLPYGVRKINVLRTFTTESLGVLIPFMVREISHENGIYYGQNAISNNMIIADRKQLLNGNSFVLGVSGSGKSFCAKSEITSLMLGTYSDIIIIDPEREYSSLVSALGGSIIDISATSKNHINALDINKNYGEGVNPVVLKSEFILSLCEQLIGAKSLGAKEKSIIDRCSANIYRKYQANDYKGTAPTLKDFKNELNRQEEEEAKEIALAIEMFTDGSLDTFAKKTNVNVDNRLLCYDILDLGKQLMPVGMLVILDSILNRITQNRKKGKNTYIFIDEIYLLFTHEYTANFLFTLWKRVRKYGAFATGITQNVDDLLQSHTARTMLANSEFIIMLNQASTDRLKLAELLNISDTQLSYITNVECGRGLMKIGSDLVPFVNRFPKDTNLYSLMTTKPGENNEKFESE